MFRSFKFAAMMLVLVILSAPLLAAVACVGGTSHAEMPCCQKHSDAAPALHSSMHQSGGNCCDVSNSKPVPVAVIQAPVPVVSTAPQASVTMPVPVTAGVRHPQSLPIRSVETSPSVLCVFLI
jgi:hypothetical protein